MNIRKPMYLTTLVIALAAAGPGWAATTTCTEKLYNTVDQQFVGNDGVLQTMQLNQYVETCVTLPAAPWEFEPWVLDGIGLDEWGDIANAKLLAGVGIGGGGRIDDGIAAGIDIAGGAMVGIGGGGRIDKRPAAFVGIGGGGRLEVTVHYRTTLEVLGN